MSIPPVKRIDALCQILYYMVAFFPKESKMEGFLGRTFLNLLEFDTSYAVCRKKLQKIGQFSLYESYFFNYTIQYVF